MSFFEHIRNGVPVDIRSWSFWRACIVLFCVFSVIGHALIEWPYCAFGATFFNTVSWTDDVLAHPFKPYMVYGVGAILCYVILIPFKTFLVKRLKRKWAAIGVFYVLGVFLGMAGELIQGFLQNQPVDGVYPLWDVSQYPGNILGQAWIVNDILLGLVITLATWHIIPKCLIQMEYLTSRQANIFTLVVVGVFAALIVTMYP